MAGPWSTAIWRCPWSQAALADLRAPDFAPVARLRDLPFAMTAHVLFPALDPDRPATTSREVIARTIRGELGFRACCSATISPCRR